jgi:hypothetical protein
MSFKSAFKPVKAKSAFKPLFKQSKPSKSQVKQQKDVSNKNFARKG